MNRIVKFRGLAKHGWVYGSLVTTDSYIKHMPAQHTKTWIVTSAFGNGGWFNINTRSYVIPSTVGQFTGLLDMDGVEIYSGDILDTHKGLYEVKWDTEVCGFALEISTIGGTSWIPLQSSYFRTLKVIGNIHIHPKLINP